MCNKPLVPLVHFVSDDFLHDGITPIIYCSVVTGSCFSNVDHSHVTGLTYQCSGIPSHILPHNIGLTLTKNARPSGPAAHCSKRHHPLTHYHPPPDPTISAHDAISQCPTSPALTHPIMPHRTTPHPPHHTLNLTPSTPHSQYHTLNALTALPENPHPQHHTQNTTHETPHPKHRTRNTTPETAHHRHH